MEEEEEEEGAFVVISGNCSAARHPPNVDAEEEGSFLTRGDGDLELLELMLTGIQT